MPERVMMIRERSLDNLRGQIARCEQLAGRYAARIDRRGRYLGIAYRLEAARGELERLGARAGARPRAENSALVLAPCDHWRRSLDAEPPDWKLRILLAAIARISSAAREAIGS